MAPDELVADATTFAGTVTTGAAVSLTVKPKLVVAVPPAPSATFKVMVAVPALFAAGVKVRVRVAPVPLITRLPLGTKVVFEEVPVTVSEATGVSMSPTSNGMLNAVS